MGLDYTKSFIETQFPVSKISKESYKERKSGIQQILPVLGKWWGRKPLVMVRAAILASLLPVSDEPKKDKEIFLKIMTMDEEGLWERKKKSIPPKVLFDNATEDEVDQYFKTEGNSSKLSTELSLKQREEFQRSIFDRISYDEKLTYCLRPENISGPSADSWKEINAHLETSAHLLSELVGQLGEKKFGHRPIVGDCFAGGGSNVFESAKIGCDVIASDLNPLAGLLTWSGINILGADAKTSESIRQFQEEVFDSICEEIEYLGIETNEQGWKAKYYLYCTEAVCPECGYKVPLSSTWIISNDTFTIAKLIEKPDDKAFSIDIKSGVTKDEFRKTEKFSTIKNSSLVCPHCHNNTSLSSIRNIGTNKGMEQWDKNDFINPEQSVFKDRLYAIKYIELKDGKSPEQLRKKPAPATDATYGIVHYVSPTENDLKRESFVRKYLSEHFNEWQGKGYIPSMKIESGEKTDELTRTRGWMYWHQLFNPRQLLLMGILNESIDKHASNAIQLSAGLLMINKMADYNAKLCRWSTTGEKSNNVFYNQALNTLINYACRSSYSVYPVLKSEFNNTRINTESKIFLSDAKSMDEFSDIWITDPPYADAVNYHELSEFFLAWDKPLFKKAFPEWYIDSKRALAIKGVGQSFNESMVEVYRNLTEYMPDNGMQIVMFTHQDTKVWAELAMILWSAGLRVTAAWCIATETDAVGIKQGNYVKGTVLMVLRKQNSEDVVFMDELYEEIRSGVKSQIDSMRNLDDKDDPDFNDGDYLLAAYVAALKVLTSYKQIEGIDVQYELTKARENTEVSPVTKLINIAKREAYDYLVPTNIDSSIWRKSTPEERFYMKGLEMELNGSKKLSAYQELARGFGIRDYKDMLANTTANNVRIKTATEYKTTQTGDGFGASVLRHLLVALHLATKEESALEGRNYLKSRYADNNEYWTLRTKMIALLEFLSKTKGKANMPHWEKNGEYAAMLKEAIKNDSI